MDLSIDLKVNILLVVLLIVSILQIYSHLRVELVNSRIDKMLSDITFITKMTMEYVDTITTDLNDKVNKLLDKNK